MKRPAILIAALALITSSLATASHADDRMDRLIMQSAATEWVFANCDNKKLDAGFLLVAQGVLSQVGVAADRARTLIAEGAKAHYADQAAACADMAWVALPD